jgi:hypothetical protein
MAPGMASPGPIDLTRSDVNVNDGTNPRSATPSPVVGDSAAGKVSAGTAPENAKDADIEGLDLSDIAKKAAYELKKKHPAVTFTSGRRDKEDQARAMAGNMVQNRNWIEDTYAESKASKACQKWVNENKEAKSVEEIAAGLKGVLDGLSEAELAQLSKHLTGEAFDVQPVEKDAAAIKKTIRGLTGLSKFLDREGGLVRWHAQF